MNYKKTISLFLLFAAIYFLPVDLDAYKKSVPLFLLSAAAFGRLDWRMCLAFIFSFLGDLMGDFHQFIPQMSFFAAAHFSFIAYFVCCGRKTRNKSAAKYLSGFLCLTVVISAMILIVPHAQGALQFAVGAYCIIIATMLYAACVKGGWVMALGAVLFVVSDYILAWNKFVEPVAYQKYAIMVPYYLAQLILFTGAWKGSGKRRK